MEPLPTTGAGMVAYWQVRASLGRGLISWIARRTPGSFATKWMNAMTNSFQSSPTTIPGEPVFSNPSPCEPGEGEGQDGGEVSGKSPGCTKSQ